MGFITECTAASEVATSIDTIYQQYRKYVMRNGNKAMGVGLLRKRFRAAGIEEKRTRDGVCVVPLRLIQGGR